MFDLDSSLKIETKKNEARDYSGTEAVKRMKARNEFSLLYRPDTSGGLMQVVRRRAFGPAKPCDMERTQLHEPEVSLLREPEVSSNAPSHFHRHHKEETRYPYWDFVARQRSAQAQRTKTSAIFGRSLSYKTRTAKPIDFGHPIRISAKIQTANVPPTKLTCFQHHKAKRSLPNLESISLAQTDLGLASIPERLLRKLSRNVEPTPRFAKLSLRNKTVKRKINKQMLSATLPKEATSVHEKGAETSSLGLEAFGQGRQLIEQAKELISNGAFARFYKADRVKDNTKLMKLLGFVN